jgi:hypothetical protein
MADPLYLSLWFPDFDEVSMMPRTLGVLKEFPYSAARPGISSVEVHPISWAEPTILERRLTPGIAPIDAIDIVSDLLHSDYAYVFEAHWDLWVYGDNGEWSKQPQLVRFIAHGIEFEDGAYEQDGHVQVDFGLDTDFLFEDIRFTPESEQRIRENVAILIAFTLAVEKNSGIRGRVLWSESQENLAQKLIARLQKTQ